MIGKGNLRTLSWCSVGLQTAVVGHLVLTQGLHRAWSVAALLILSLASMLPWGTPKLFTFLVTVIGLLEAMLIYLDLLDVLPWIDKVLHFYATFAVVSALVSTPIVNRRVTITWLSVLILGLLVGGAWEVLENIMIPQPLLDTLGDLIADSLGALAAIPFGLWAGRTALRDV